MQYWCFHDRQMDSPACHNRSAVFGHGDMFCETGARAKPNDPSPMTPKTPIPALTDPAIMAIFSLRIVLKMC